MTRLCKQYDFLDNREKEMIRRGLATLDKLDVAEATEKEDVICHELAV
jgi:hypothetical protein